MASTDNKLNISTEDENCHFSMLLASASVLPMAMKAAIELQVFDIIAKAGSDAYLSPSEIASHLPTHNPNAPIMLDRVLRLLASHSLLNCSLLIKNDGQVQRLYGLAPACKNFVRNENGVSLSSTLELIQDRVIMESWYYLKDAVLEGGLPFNKAHGKAAPEYVGTDPRFCNIFRSSMVDFNTLLIKKIIEMYKGFEGLKVLVDVGGGDGTVLKTIISMYPEIKGVNFDLPQVIETCSPASGVEHVAGDMFVSIPKGDAIVMKWILHTQNEEQCLKLLNKCYEALPVEGKIIIIDLVIPDIPETSMVVKSIFQYDLIMMNLNPDGKERTEKEFQVLAKEAGFAGVKVACCAYNFSVIEFYKTM